jgi:hypothetical protein
VTRRSSSPAGDVPVTGSHTVVLDDVFIEDSAIALTRPAGA